jgi:integrase
MSAHTPRLPKYRKHSSGQARVTLDGKDFLLGAYGSAASQEAYRRKVAEWLETGGKAAHGADAPPLSVNELILAYWKHAAAYYGYGIDGDRKDSYCLRDALRVVKELYGRTPARDFGPLALKACRSLMLAKDWSRNYANAQVDRIRRMFRWAAEEELLPGAVYQNLRSVAGLRRGKSAARETAKIRPAPPADVEAALPFMPPAVAAMVRLQLLTGCRPAEVCRLRPIDLDMTNPACWVYRPEKHKTEHLGRDRMVFIGPKAQQVLLPFLGTKVDAYCFCPAASEQRRNAERTASRRTPLSLTRKARKKSGPRRRRAPGDRYDTNSYRRAIARACLKAEVPPWGPNRLRHSRATELRPYGLDLAKTILGHAKVETTQIYAEKDLIAAMELVSRIG